MTKFIKSVMDFSVYYHTFYMMSVTCLKRGNDFKSHWRHNAYYWAIIYIIQTLTSKFHCTEHTHVIINEGKNIVASIFEVG